MAEPPEGAPTFVFTDIESSSALWEAVPGAMARALRAHDALIFRACSARKGYVVKAEGDAFMIAFSTVEDAINFALLTQQALARLSWPQLLEQEQEERGVQGPLGLRVRIGIHQGDAERRPNPVTGRSDYFGQTVNIAARLCDMAHGAQVLISGVTLKQCTPPHATVVTLLGPTPIRGMKKTIRVYQTVSAAWWPIEFPALRLGRIQTHDGVGQPTGRRDLNTEMEAVADQLFARAQLDRFAGRFEAAVHELRALQAVVQWLADDERLAQCLLEFSALVSNQSNYSESLYYLDQVIGFLDGEQYPSLLCRALIAKSSKQRLLYLFDEARETGQLGLAAALNQNDDRLVARARATLAELDRMEGNFEAAEAGMRSAFEVLNAHDDRSSVREHENDFGMVLVELGRAEGAELLHNVIDEYEGLNMVIAAAVARVNLSLYYLDQNDAAEFHELNDAAFAVFVETGRSDSHAACILNRAFLHLGSGNIGAAHEDLLEAGNQFPIHFEQGTDLEAGCLRAWVAFLRGDLVLARQGSDYFAKEAPAVRQLLGPMTLQLQQVLGAILDEDWSAAADLLTHKDPPASVTYRVIWRSMKGVVDQHIGD